MSDCNCPPGLDPVNCPGDDGGDLACACLCHQDEAFGRLVMGVLEELATVPFQNYYCRLGAAIREEIGDE